MDVETETRAEIKDHRSRIAVMQAYLEGERIECYDKMTGEWFSVSEPCWDWDCSDYRVAPEVIHRIGNKYLRDGRVYLLASMDTRKVGLINRDTGHRWSTSRGKVGNSNHLTEEEWKTVSLGHPFKLIEEAPYV